VCYWCWTDDELSKTYTREMLGMEFDADEQAEGKVYRQSGETMGIIRYNGSYRPSSLSGEPNYFHTVGKGSVFVFNWNLDAFMFKGEVIELTYELMK
jgi:hypothetical protein